MKASTLLRGTLIALGIVNFVYQGRTHRTRVRATAPGQHQVGSERTRTLPRSPIVGAVALASGLVMLFVGASTLFAPVPEGGEVGSSRPARS